MKENKEKMRKLRDKLEAGIRQLIPNAILNGHPEFRLSNTLNLTLPEGSSPFSRPRCLPKPSTSDTNIPSTPASMRAF